MSISYRLPISTLWKAADSISVIAIGRRTFHSTIANELGNAHSFEKSIPAGLTPQKIESNNGVVKSRTQKIRNAKSVLFSFRQPIASQILSLPRRRLSSDSVAISHPLKTRTIASSYSFRSICRQPEGSEQSEQRNADLLSMPVAPATQSPCQRGWMI